MEKLEKILEKFLEKFFEKSGKIFRLERRALGLVTMASPAY